MNANASTGVFLNGKAQVIEILQAMTQNEKWRLLNNIRVLNPQLASELVEQSLTFDSLGMLSDHELKLVFNYISAPVLGVALKNVDQEFQRKMLSLAPKNYAESAYETMVTPLTNENRDIKRAQSKIINVLVSLSKKKQIKF